MHFTKHSPNHHSIQHTAQPKLTCPYERRGLKDTLFAHTDCLKGLLEAIAAIAAIFPETEVQLCIAHQIRNSMRYVN